MSQLVHNIGEYIISNINMISEMLSNVVNKVFCINKKY